MPSHQRCQVEWFWEIHAGDEARTGGLPQNNDYHLLLLEQGSILRTSQQLGGYKNKLNYTESTDRFSVAGLWFGASLNQAHKLKRWLDRWWDCRGKKAKLNKGRSTKGIQAIEEWSSESVYWLSAQSMGWEIHSAHSIGLIAQLWTCIHLFSLGFFSTEFWRRQAYSACFHLQGPSLRYQSKSIGLVFVGSDLKTVRATSQRFNNRWGFEVIRHIDLPIYGSEQRDVVHELRIFRFSSWDQLRVGEQQAIGGSICGLQNVG